MKTVKQTRREAKRLFRLCFVNGLLDESRIRQVAQKIIEARRRGSAALLQKFLYLVKLDQVRHTAEIESASPLTDDLRASVQAGLARRYGPGIRATFTQNPELIGGMRIKVGSDLYDGSIRAGLAELEKRF
ncbi:MAG: F0F1-type synthase delta subunit-like protein [Acidobacteria bacterium]|nr:F0F1-type synthase delta subunit-like protein [Acidobacteriota bacterium]